MTQIVIAPTPVTHYCYANELLSAPHSHPGAQPGMYMCTAQLITTSCVGCTTVV